MTAVDAESCAVVAAAADIICSLRGADLAGWTPPWRGKDDAAAPALPSACDGGGGGQEVGGDAAGGMAWPAVARGKRSRSRRAGTPSASGSASAGAAAKDDEKEEKKKKARRGARGSPASPLDFSGGSGSGASTSGGEDGAFCSQPAPSAAAAAAYQPAAPAPPSSSIKVGGLAGRRSILPVPPPRPGQRPRKKMRLPEIQQLVRSLSVENDALREEMKLLQRACTALSKENGKLETRLDHSSKRNGMVSAEDKAKPEPCRPQEAAAEQDTQNGFVLPDLNLPADD